VKLQTYAPRIVPIKPHPDYDEIRDAIQKLSKKGRTFSAFCYRCTEPQFADQIVSGLGSQLHGARWTPKNSFPTVYLSETVEAALQEYLARGRRMKIPDYKSLPMVMAWVKVKVSNLLDTTDAEIAGILNPLLATDKIHWRGIQDRREAVSQAMGRAIKDVCFSGLIAPSQALPGGRNIVIFPRKLTSSESLSAPALKPAPLK
jgi:RES domain-containing protein